MTKANLNRRGVLAGATAAVAGSAASAPALATTSAPDAALLALEPIVEAIATGLRAATKAMNAAEATVDARRPVRLEALAPPSDRGVPTTPEERRRQFAAWLVDGRRLMVEHG